MAAEEGRQGHGPNNLHTLHANNLQVEVIEAIVCDQLRTCTAWGEGEGRDYQYKGCKVSLSMSTIKYKKVKQESDSATDFLTNAVYICTN